MDGLLALFDVPFGPWDPATTAHCRLQAPEASFAPAFVCDPAWTELPLSVVMYVRSGSIDVASVSASGPSCDAFADQLRERLGDGDAWESGPLRGTFRRYEAGGYRACNLYVESTTPHFPRADTAAAFERRIPFGFGSAEGLTDPPLPGCRDDGAGWQCPTLVGAVPATLSFVVERGLYYGFQIRTDPARCEALRTELAWLVPPEGAPDAGMRGSFVSGPDGCAVFAWSTRYDAALDEAQRWDGR